MALVVQIVMARLLVPSDFGLLAIILVVVNVGNIIVISGLSNSLVQAESVEQSDFSTVFWLTLFASAAMYIAVFFSAPIFSDIYNAPELTSALRALGFLFPLSSIESVQTAFVQRDLKFKVLFKATIAATISSGAGGVLLAIAGAGLWSLIAQQLIYHIINSISLIAQTRWLPKFNFNPQRARKHFSFGVKIMVPSLMETAYDSISDLLVGKQFGSSSLGFLSQGKKYPVAIDSMISGTLQPVLLAAVSRAQSDIGTVKSIASRTLKTSYFFIAPIMMCFALTADPIICLLLGEQWRPAVPFLQLYCISSALSSFHVVNYESFNGVGRSDLFLKTKMVTVSYGLIFLFLAVFVFKDVTMVVAAYAFSSILSTAVNAFPNRKLIGYSYFEQIKDIAPSLISALLSCAAAFPIPQIVHGDIFSLLLQWAVFAAAYILFSLITNKEQVRFFANEIKNRFCKKDS